MTTTFENLPKRQEIDLTLTDHIKLKLDYNPMSESFTRTVKNISFNNIKQEFVGEISIQNKKLVVCFDEDLKEWYFDRSMSMILNTYIV